MLTAPQDDVPLPFIEADNCHETAEEIADKLEKYARFSIWPWRGSGAAAASCSALRRRSSSLVRCW